MVTVLLQPGVSSRRCLAGGLAMEKFHGVDYYEIEELFTEQERLVRDTARAFVDEQVLPVIRAHHRAGTFPTDLISKMGALGFFGASLTGYGCAGVSNVAYGLMM
ncbi:MAG: acyl-CoA dehydrogenase family protein, partial [candidate division NC10 bacterium]